MPVLNFAASSDGLVVDVRIGLSRAQVQSLRTSGHPVPGAVQLRALVDSGTDVTSIADAAIMPLGNTPLDSVLANTANGMTLVYRYAVSVTILSPDGNPAHNLVRPNFQLLGLAYPPMGFDVLVGLDILKDCLFLLDGPSDRFTIAF